MEKPLKKTVHYYPFGLKHKGYNNVISSNGNSVAQRWKFGGNEYNEELGLNWYDITARNYDASLGRWMNLDPLAEIMLGHSAYNYAFDNPIYFIDSDGLSPTGNYFTGYADFGNGRVIYHEDIKSQDQLDALFGVGIATYSDVYYDEGTGTYYDADGNIHNNMVLDWGSMKYEWSFWLWINSLGKEGNAIDRIGSGFVLWASKGGGNGRRPNTVAEHPEDNIEIEDADILIKLLIGGKLKGPVNKSKMKASDFFKSMKNGMKDMKGSGKRAENLVKVAEKVKSEEMKKNGTLSRINFTGLNSPKLTIDTIFIVKGYLKSGSVVTGVSDNATKMRQDSVHISKWTGGLDSLKITKKIKKKN